jgi:uncharacterized protein (DUF488 family)
MTADYPPGEAVKPMNSEEIAAPNLYSVGHSHHDLAAFVALLQGAGVTAVADVRSQPFSQRLPQFNRPVLEQALKANGIAYVFLGDLLGGRPEAADLYDDEGRINYEKVRRTPAFREGLERLLRGASQYIVAMMCSEADPLECHRGLMITPALTECGVHPLHLRRDGNVETTAEMEQRLLEETRVGDGIVNGLFAASVTAEEWADLVAEAYRQQARRKGYHRPPDTGQ